MSSISEELLSANVKKGASMLGVLLMKQCDRSTELQKIRKACHFGLKTGQAGARVGIVLKIHTTVLRKCFYYETSGSRPLSIQTERSNGSRQHFFPFSFSFFVIVLLRVK